MNVLWKLIALSNWQCSKECKECKECKEYKEYKERILPLLAMHTVFLVTIYSSNIITKMKRLLALASLATLAGCSTYAVPRYSISADNVVALKSVTGNGVDVGIFTQSPIPNQSPNEIMCRGVGPIKTPDGETFSAFIRSALVSELKIAGTYSISAPIRLTGNLDHIDFSSVTGTWNLGLTVESSNGRALNKTENYSYTSSYFGETACNQTAQALMPAVQDLISKVVHDPEFISLLK